VPRQKRYDLRFHKAEEARHFAQTGYLAALVKGSKLGGAEKAEGAKRLSRYTGLSEDYLIKADRRVNLPKFMKERQRSRGLTTGRLDARFSGYSYDLLGEFAEYGPQDTSITGPFTAAFNSYVRADLKFGQDKVYHTGSDEAGTNWDWKHRSGDNFGFPGSTNVEGDLIRAMLTNPHLQIEVANGFIRSGHALLRYGIHHGASGPPGNAADKYSSAILRRSSHDVPARRGPFQAQNQHR
jgi:carboxypeptidase C (cathepsin A)